MAAEHHHIFTKEVRKKLVRDVQVKTGWTALDRLHSIVVAAEACCTHPDSDGRELDLPECWTSTTNLTHREEGKEP